MTSLSVVLRNMEPLASSSARKAPPLTRVSVVAQGERSLGVVHQKRLGVFDVGLSRGGIAVVPDGDAALEFGDAIFRENIGHEPHADLAVHPVPIGGHDARAFLPSVLQGVETEIRHVGRLGMAVYPEDAAFFFRVVIYPVRHLTTPRRERPTMPLRYSAWPDR